MSTVEGLLRELGLADHLPAFRDNDIDDDVLHDLTGDDLRELGILSLGQRKRLLAAIAALRANPPAPTEDEDTTVQRREVAVLFSDLTGYTKLINRLPVEDIHDILAGMYDRFDAIVRRMGGTVDRHIGDCVMAVFGAPVSYGNDVERALRCAVEMHEAMGELSRLHGEPLSVHIGVAAGMVLYSNKGQGELAKSGFTVTGSTINLASRLADTAVGGETLISDRIYGALRGRVLVDPAEEVTAEGFDTAVTAYRFRAFKRTQPESRFVGRGAELSVADNALQACAGEGRGRVLYLTGEAGMGKTSLLDQIARRAQARGIRTRRVLVLDFGLGGDETVPRAILSQLTGLSIGATASAVDSAARALRQEGLLDERAAHIFTLAMGVAPEGASRVYLDSLDDAALAEGQNALVARLVAAEAAKAPLLIGIEDLHWADAETLALVARLAQVSARAPVILVLTSRIEANPLDTDWRADLAGADLARLDLAPLSTKEAQELAALLQAPRSDMILRCVDKAEGNPLFLAQLLQHAAEVEDDAVPGTIQSLIQSKIDRLSPDDRAVLNAASVLGQRFRIEAATAVAGSEVYDPRALIDSGLIREFGGDLLFSHALIRDGVYQTILRNDLRRLHRNAADWFRPTDALLTAEHLGKAASPEAPAAFARAAQEAADGRRLSAALALVERGLALDPAPQLRVRLNLMAGDLLRDLGRGEASVAAFRAALADSTAPEDAVEARIGLIGTMRIMDRLDETAPLFEEAAREAEASGQFAALSKLHYLQGSIRFPRGDFRGCLEAHMNALSYAEKVDSPELKARALSGLGDAYYAQGRMFRAHDVFERCLDLCTRHDLVAVEAANRFMLGTVRIYMNQTEDALREALQSAALAQKAGLLRPEIVSRLTAGWVLHSLARREEARAEVARGLAAAAELGARRFEPFLKETLVRVLLSEGRDAEAAALADEVLAQTRELGAMTFIGPWVLATAAMTRSGAAADALLDEGEALLASGCVGHNFFRFYVYGILSCLDRGELARVRRYADALAAYTAAEPTPWSDFYVALGRAGADAGEGRNDALPRLRRLEEEAHRAGLVTSRDRIARILARAGRPARIA
jgi:class 3 adenylate cyclase/tetratricopeptide (TPR) repeat protein